MRLLDPTALLANARGTCRVAAAGKALYFDDEHLTTEGATLLEPLLADIFRNRARSIGAKSD